jgi:glycosyltransferase involved in cell wall biosynthesis
MNILMVLDEEFPPDVRVENEIKTLAEAGHQITLISYTRQDKAREDSFETTRIIRIPISTITYKLKALALLTPSYFNFWKRHLEKVLKDGSFDAMHLHDLPLLKPCLELCRKHDIPLIADFHENRPEIMKMYHHVITFPGNLLISLKKWADYQRKYSGMADKLILVTPEARNFYISEYNIPKEKIHVVPNYADPAKLFSFPVKKDIIERYNDKILLSYLGNTGSRRGTKTIIEAARLLQNNTEYHFVIIGESREQEDLQGLIDRYGLKNVELPGYIPFGEAVSYINASSAGLCPFLRNIHHDTTYANKMFQYMAFGKAIIASDCPSQENIIKEEKCGLIFRAGEPEELAGCARKIADKAFRDKMGENGRKAILEKYNTASGNRVLVDLYEDLSNKSQHL